MTSNGKYDEIIIVAGGVGSRLKSVVGSTPKCLSMVETRPFIYWQLVHLANQGFRTFVFALGQGSDLVIQYLQSLIPELTTQFHGLQVLWSVEERPLGTGGAIKKASLLCRNPHLCVTNGDSLYSESAFAALPLHLNRPAWCTLLLNHQTIADRFGLVLLDPFSQITHFLEKKTNSSGLINTGIYWVNRFTWPAYTWPETFSWETDFLAPQAGKNTIFGHPSQGHFIDIGTPHSLQDAQKFIPQFFRSP